MSRREWRFLPFVLALTVTLAGSCGGSTHTFPQPADIGDGWVTATLSDLGLDPDPFGDLVDHISGNDARAVHGILVVKDGKLVFEEYFDGYRFDYDDPEFRGEPVEYNAATTYR